LLDVQAVGCILLSAKYINISEKEKKNVGVNNNLKVHFHDKIEGNLFFKINVSSGEKDVEIPTMVDGWLATLPFPSTVACRKTLSHSLSLSFSFSM